MRTTIDRAGRLVLPKQARDQLGLKAGDELDIEMSSDSIHLKPVHELPRLVKEGHVLVHTGSVAHVDVVRFIEEQRDARTAELIRRSMSP